MKSAKDIKDFTLGLIGIGIIVGIPASYAWTYGNHWRFGDKYYMPKTLVDETGRRYPDGEPIDMLTLATLKIEEEVWLGCLAFIAAMLGCVWFLNRRHEQGDGRSAKGKGIMCETFCLGVTLVCLVISAMLCGIIVIRDCR